MTTINDILDRDENRQFLSMASDPSVADTVASIPGYGRICRFLGFMSPSDSITFDPDLLRNSCRLKFLGLFHLAATLFSILGLTDAPSATDIAIRIGCVSFFVVFPLWISLQRSLPGILENPDGPFRSLASFLFAASSRFLLESLAGAILLSIFAGSLPVLAVRIVSGILKDKSLNETIDDELLRIEKSWTSGLLGSSTSLLGRQRLACLDRPRLVQTHLQMFGEMAASSLASNGHAAESARISKTIPSELSSFFDDDMLGAMREVLSQNLRMHSFSPAKGLPTLLQIVERRAFVAESLGLDPELSHIRSAMRAASDSDQIVGALPGPLPALGATIPSV